MTLKDQEAILQQSEVDLKIIKFEDKVEYEMRPQLNFILEKRDKIYEELSEYL